MKRFKDFTADEMRLLNSMWSDASEQERLKFARQVGNSAGSIHRELANYRRYAKLFGRDKGEPSMKPAPVSVPRQTPPPKAAPAPKPAQPQVSRIAEALEGLNPAFEVATYEAPLTVQADNCVITSDWHLPRFHWRLWLASVYVAKAIKATAYFALGDLRDNNQAGVTAWPRSWHIPEATGDEVADQLIDVMRRTQRGAGCHVYTCEGNHDEWPEKNLGGQYWFNRALKEIGNVTATRMQYINLETSKGDWRLTHPKNSSINLLTVPRNLHMRRHANKSVACAHTHKLGMGVCTGHYWVMETGGLYWRDAMQYTNQKDTTHELAAPGFAFLVDGDPYIISEHHSLRWVLRDLYPEYRRQLQILQQRLKGYYKPVRHTVGAAA